MNRFRKILAIIVLTALGLVLLGCTQSTEGGFFAALDRPCVMKIGGVRNGVAFEAEMTLGAREANGGRGGVMKFTAPSAMAGIEVKTEGGVWGVSLDGIKFSGLSAELLGVPLGIFTEKLEVVKAERLDGEEKRTLMIAKTALGSAEFLIDSKSGAPVSVIEKDGSGNVVMEFEIIEYNVSETESKGE